MSANTFTKYTKYTKKELESYVADPDACVHKLEWEDLISVLPKYLGNICEGVKACLTQKIGTYDRKVDGVILAFKNTKILSPLSAIRPNSVRLHVKLRTDFYVFRPQIGATIEGTVQYVSSNYLSAVIYRVFNVTIKLLTQKIRSFTKGMVISFVITAFDMKSDLPFIEGQLISKSGGDKPLHNNVKKEKSTKQVSPIKFERNENGDDEEKELEDIFKPVVDANHADSAILTKDKSKRGKKRKHSKMNGHVAKEDQSDEEMQLSINALLNNLEKELSDAVESDPNISGVEMTPKVNKSVEKSQSSKKKKHNFKQEIDELVERDPSVSCAEPTKMNQSVENSRSSKKKKKKKTDIDSLEAELLLKFAAEYNEPEVVDHKMDVSDHKDNEPVSFLETENVTKTKKKKKKIPKEEEDDFEASIMSSILKCAAEAESRSPPKKKGKNPRKSVRFDNTITEASFNAFDSSELLEISQLQSPALSSTLKDV